MKNQYTEDLLDRQRTINKWTECFIKNGKNLVLAVHAEWGMGKTFFAKQWYEYLKKLNYPVCYIDAFENDFIDDPFKVITFSIVSQLKENKKILKMKVKIIYGKQQNSLENIQYNLYYHYYH